MPSQPPRRQSLATTLVVLASIIPSAVSFSPSSFRSGAVATPLHTTASRAQLSTTSLAASSNERNKDSVNINYSNNKPILSTLAALTILTTTLTTSFQTANAYEESDYASETVTTVVQQLKENAGDVDKTFGTLEEIAKIITEGKGVGGSLSYDGIRLTEGYVADEDTTIYNPGLSLLTNSEKERLVSAIISNRKTGLSTNHWSENNEYAFDFLKTKLDPLHMYELEGYLSILPYYGAVLYLGALFVQKNFVTMGSTDRLPPPTFHHNAKPFASPTLTMVSQLQTYWLLSSFLFGSADSFSYNVRANQSATQVRSSPINEDIFTISPPVRIQGSSLKTWSYEPGPSKRIQVSIKSLGRPIEASVELWQTPTYIPTKFTVECEDASENIVHSVFEVPENTPVTIAIYNTENVQFPLEVSVSDTGLESAIDSFEGEQSEHIQGGRIKSFTFGEEIESVEVLLVTKHRNLKAMLEILQGPNDDNEIIEVETEDGRVHPFYTVIQTPGGANTLRVVNRSPVEFPFEAFVRPFVTVEDGNTQYNRGGPYF
ncbi:predicted protein [Thalassiosira pseudonana CCMP1335]|uniref:Uncharacterized protein n=1 Tax=Thalassiosira pseudonana TaxID=35128 RepID=B8LE09_THAPS|nr:predicted protein [Thalassiosira pseudonana CCMP1335]EED86411.1 predicted protein [Thalassiosira pseudonana CCMP1335]